MMTSPCRNCAERTIGCHSRCIAYLRFRVHQDRLRDLRSEMFMQEDPWFTYRAVVNRRVQRRLNGRA